MNKIDELVERKNKLLALQMKRKELEQQGAELAKEMEIEGRMIFLRMRVIATNMWEKSFHSFLCYDDFRMANPWMRLGAFKPNGKDADIPLKYIELAESNNVSAMTRQIRLDTYRFIHNQANKEYNSLNRERDIKANEIERAESKLKEIDEQLKVVNKSRSPEREEFIKNLSEKAALAKRARQDTLAARRKREQEKNA